MIWERQQKRQKSFFWEQGFRQVESLTIGSSPHAILKLRDLRSERKRGDDFQEGVRALRGQRAEPKRITRWGRRGERSVAGVTLTQQRKERDRVGKF